MKKIALIILLLSATTALSMAQPNKTIVTDSEKIAVVWSSADPEVAERLVLLYTLNAAKQKWFDDVVLIVWGPSAKLLAENEKMQNYIKEMAKVGVKLQACINCTEHYKVTKTLKDLGVEVIGMGVPLSNYLKNGYHTITF